MLMSILRHSLAVKSEDRLSKTGTLVSGAGWRRYTVIPAILLFPLYFYTRCNFYADTMVCRS